MSRGTDREYFYGPDYVDEFLCQIDRDGRVVWMLQDANYNVVALLALDMPRGGAAPTPRVGKREAFAACQGLAGPGLATPTGPIEGEPVEQYTYDPYGAVIAREVFDTPPGGGGGGGGGFGHAVNRVGHQGLFFDRFDGTANDPSVTTNAVGLYYNRNRHYSPGPALVGPPGAQTVTSGLGRFLQRDPNETALPVLMALAMNGESLQLTRDTLDPKGQYSDGFNLYSYARSDPLNNRDPTGLFSLLELFSGPGAARAGAGSTAAAAASSGYFRAFADAISFRNQLFSSILDRAAQIGGQRGFDFLDKGVSLLYRLSDRAFTATNYREGFQWLTGGRQAGFNVHHIFPQKLAEWFAQRGINVHVPLWLTEIEAALHLRLAAAYNAAWQTFRAQNPNATVDQIFAAAQRFMSSIYGVNTPW